MAVIVVLGGTGYAGSNIVREAVQRRHRVIAMSRHEPPAEQRVPGVEYRVADVLDADALSKAIADAAPDVLVSALSPRGELTGAGRLRGVLTEVAALARQSGIRLGVIGGAGSLLVAPGGPLLVDTESFPAEFRPEAREMAGVLDDLRASDPDLDWFLVSPAAGFGAFNPGEATGHYRVGGDLLLTDERGDSSLSGADLGLAVVDEIEHPAHRRERFAGAS